MHQYELSKDGYHFETGSEADCFGRSEAAVADKRWVVIPLWHPQFLHHRYMIRSLEEPKGLLGGVDHATLIVRRDAEELIGQPAIEALGELYLGNPKVSALDDFLRK